MKGLQHNADHKLESVAVPTINIIGVFIIIMIIVIVIFCCRAGTPK